ncbi:hypothetical protein QE152_g19757 [Popillia japonica]|uniref:DDE Tnp4 domain-containing protein n=1 Tax=Popillia japonica TaxID=7064 RepID=A0AAW1KRI3_POPJA
MDLDLISFPVDSCLPGQQTPVPYVFVADDAFLLSRRILKPYSSRVKNNAYSNIDLDNNRHQLDNINEQQHGNTARNEFLETRNAFCSCFNNKGSVPWQDTVIS